MLRITKKLAHPQPASAILKLPFEQRQKSRLKVTLDDGREAGLFLDRGDVLRGGDCLVAEDDSVIKIEADNETVSMIQSDDPLLLARACYHLGNRHVAVQMQQLGLEVNITNAPFEPESGAYGGHHEGGGHSHSHGAHSHSHSHG